MMTRVFVIRVTTALLASLLSSSFSWGQTAGRLLNHLDKQRQEQRINEELQDVQRRQQQYQKQQELEENKETSPDPKRSLSFEKITFTNNDGVSRQLENELSRTYLHRPLDAAGILEVVRAATNRLIEKGYSTSLVSLVAIKPAERELVLEIRYGHIGDIYLNGKKDSFGIALSCPMDSGDRFNIYDIDTTIDNLKTVSDQATVSVKPSDKAGYSDLYFSQSIRGFDGRISFDNSGSRTLGEYKAAASLSLNNLLGLNDSFFLYANVGLLENMSDNRSNVFAAGYSLPIGTWNIGYNFQLSDSETLVHGAYSKYSYLAQTYKHILSIKKTAWRNQTSKLTLLGDFTVRENRNEVDDIRLVTSSGIFASAAIGAEYTTTLLGGFLYSAFEYRRGIEAFGSKSELPDSYYTPLYDKFSLNVSYQKLFVAGKSACLTYRGNLGASYSDDDLLYDDKFLVGDEYTVRGFKESSVAWDYGLYINNTLSLQILSSNALLSALEPFVGIDFGYGKDYLLGAPDQLWGVAIGVKARYRAFSMALTASKALHKSDNMPYERLPIYFTMSAFF